MPATDRHAAARSVAPSSSRWRAQQCPSGSVAPDGAPGGQGPSQAARRLAPALTRGTHICATSAPVDHVAHSRARPSFPRLRRFGETRSREPEGRCRGAMGHRRGQRDASRRHRRLARGAGRPGSLPPLRRRIATDVRSWSPACLVRGAPSQAASTGGSGLCPMRDVARRPAPADHRLRSALCIAPAASARPGALGGVSPPRSPTFAHGRDRAPQVPR